MTGAGRSQRAIRERAIKEQATMDCTMDSRTTVEELRHTWKADEDRVIDVLRAVVHAYYESRREGDGVGVYEADEGFTIRYNGTRFALFPTDPQDGDQ